jgi:hypothetical protein
MVASTQSNGAALVSGPMAVPISIASAAAIRELPELLLVVVIGLFSSYTAVSTTCAEAIVLES